MKITSSRNSDPYQGRKLSALERYYRLVQKGCSPEQTRKDLRLSMDDIARFDFSVFAGRETQPS